MKNENTAPVAPASPVSNSPAQSANPRVAIIMGSQSDWPVLEAAAKTLGEFGVPFEARVISAHRTPHAAFEFATSAEKRGLKCIIAGAGMAAHLAGVMAGLTQLPVLGVPMESPQLKGLDSLLSTVQMPGGVPVATFAIGKAGATNAALFAVEMMAAMGDERLAGALRDYRKKQAQKILEIKL